MPIKNEYLTERQGRTFVLYQGILDLAHEEGLDLIRTSLIQVPSDENGQTCICFAEVHTSKGTFTGIGDANPGNVSRNIIPHIIRMAETRSKARALRDAVNIGEAAMEELSDGDDEAHGPPRQAQPRPQPQPQRAEPPRNQPSAPEPPRGPVGETATPAQQRAIFAIGKDQHGLSPQEVHSHSFGMFGVKVEELSRKQASDFIARLKDNSPLPDIEGEDPDDLFPDKGPPAPSTPPRVEPAGSARTLNSWGDLFTTVLADFGISRTECLKLLGLNSTSDIPNPNYAQLYRQMSQVPPKGTR